MLCASLTDTGVERSEEDVDARLETLDCYHRRMVNAVIKRRSFPTTIIQVLRKAFAWRGIGLN